MKNLVLIIVIINIIAFTACEKLSTTKNVTLNIIVRDTFELKGISGQTVRLKELKSTFPGVEVNEIESEVSNANGTCTFSFEMKKGSKYNYECELQFDENNYLNSWYKDYYTSKIIRLNKEENDEIIFTLIPKSTIVFELKNLSGAEEIQIYMDEPTMRVPFGFYNLSPNEELLKSKGSRSGKIKFSYFLLNNNLILDSTFFEVELSPQEEKHIHITY